MDHKQIIPIDSKLFETKGVGFNTLIPDLGYDKKFNAEGKKMCIITSHPDKRIENMAKVEQLLKPTHFLILSSFSNWEFPTVFSCI